MVERQAEPPVDIGLDRMLPVAEGPHILPGRNGAEFGRRSVFVGGADEQHVAACLAAETRMHVGRKQRARKIAEMLDAVHIRQRTGNENFGHGGDLSRQEDAEPDESKSPPARPEGPGFGLRLARKSAHYPVRSNLMRSGRGIRVWNWARAKITAGSP